MVLTEYIIRLCAAFVFGAIIGAERQSRQKNAGLRTNTLVCLGSAGFVLLSFSLSETGGDPTRIASQVVTGVGFLGGGLIIKDGFSVRGINTAATIWCSAAVGALSACALYWQALIMALLVVLTHSLMRPLGEILGRHSYFKSRNESLTYVLRIRCKDQVENRLRVLIINAITVDPHLQLRSLKSADAEEVDYCVVTAEIHAEGKHDLVIEKLASQLTVEYGVTQVRWEVEMPVEES